MIAQIVELGLLIFICVWTDLKDNKIKNKYITPIALVGILTNVFFSGVGWKSSLLGLILPFFVFFIFFYLRMFRAGDIKEMMAIGAIMGYVFIGNSIFYIFAVGGIWSIIKMLISGNAKERFSYLGRYIIGIIKTFQIMPYENESSKDEAHFPFAVSIGLGALINLFAEHMGYYIFFR